MKKRYKRPYFNYRKIYRKHYGDIPKDAEGRSYEIHHIDGDHTNNSIDNLIAVSIQEHFNIHLAQGDLYACLRIAQKMKRSIEEIRELASKHAKDQVLRKTHNFLGGGVQKARVNNGTHNFLGGDIQRRSNTNRIMEGTHNLIGASNPVHKMIQEGNYHLLGPSANKRMLAEGKHPSQQFRTCVHCNKSVSGGNYVRWHGDRCKMKSKMNCS